MAQLSLLLLFALVASGWGASDLAGEEAPPADRERYESSIVWKADPDTALFVPERVLNEKEIELLPLGEDGREALGWRIAMSLNPPGPDDPPLNPSGYVKVCRDGWGSRFPNPAAPPGRTELESLALESPVMLEGTVEAVVPGWDNLYQRVASAVHVRIAQLAKDRLGQLSLGETVLFVVVGGQLRIGAAEVCDIGPVNPNLPAEGDHLLLLGGYSPEQKNVLSVRKYLRVDDLRDR